MIREEIQRESDSKPPQPFEAQAPVTPPETDSKPEAADQGPGLLTKMFRQPGGMGVRAISLHNLLDKPPSGDLSSQSIKVRGFQCLYLCVHNSSWVHITFNRHVT